MKLSIIIPIFNSFKYLDDLLDSILSQLSRDIEILLIDDGSKVCKQQETLKNKYKSGIIKYYYKPHGGVSSARNLGIKHAENNYLWFVDSDDMLHKHSIKEILYCIDSYNKVKPDLIFMNHNKFSHNKYFDSNSPHMDNHYIQQCDTDQMFHYLYSSNNMMCGVWSFICRKEVIYQNNLFFNEDLIIYEDIDWIMQAILSSKKYNFISKPTYQYRVDNNESLTNKDYSIKKFTDVLNITEKWYLYFKNIYTGRYAKDTMMKYFMSQHRLLLMMIGKLPPEKRRYAIKLHSQFSQKI